MTLSTAPGRAAAGARITSILLGALILLATAGCEPTLRRETGIVVSVDSPALGRVDSFQLLTAEGEALTFDTTELAFRSEFPAPHLTEHMIIGDRIIVTYRQDGDRRIVTQLDDSEGPGH